MFTGRGVLGWKPCYTLDDHAVSHRLETRVTCHFYRDFVVYQLWSPANTVQEILHPSDVLCDQVFRELVTDCAVIGIWP